MLCRHHALDTPTLDATHVRGERPHAWRIRIVRSERAEG
jgi:hypothetical protein